ncbi:HypC/HybG/HupF family hydrogenase formation chaperone [Aneurinibacillus uraniidurans]|uniref:HypC/HybG/HupF family hydrogenase formation chaperone n=1 Tax=Aneurinibacillus uraniidurans TaxID=2966586 RepID=UPI002348FF1B|nr:HypC/HybG/HupF family hydrogenase formation chaperone [Aneurinibacillus sp. B1]WCN37435.1 HypC/HybG/HupF family hydrogenase formation chaperone [Aneurinibacillus sp. B1]
MCLSVPAKVVEVYLQEWRAKVDYLGSTKIVGIGLLEQVEIDQYVLVHAGEAIQVIDESSARNSLDVWKEVLDL